MPFLKFDLLLIELKAVESIGSFEKLKNMIMHILDFSSLSFLRYKNIPQMSFDDTDREPDQTFSLNRDLTGELEYATK